MLRHQRSHPMRPRRRHNLSRWNLRPAETHALPLPDVEVAAATARQGGSAGVPAPAGLQVPECAGRVLRAVDVRSGGCVQDVGAAAGGLSEAEEADEGWRVCADFYGSICG